MAPEWARHTAKLPLPDGGSGESVWVIGSAHVSASSAEEAAELIRTVRPGTVVVELDAARYEQLLKSQRLGRAGSGAEVASRGGSAAKLASLAWNGKLPAFGMSLAYAGAGALLGSEPGAEFVAAVRAAEEIGAVVVLGDRDANATISRLRARLRAARSEALSSASGSASKRLPSQEEDLPPLLRAAGCVHADAALVAAKRLLRDVLAETGVARPDDLAAVRACAVGVIEQMRDDTLRRAVAPVLAAGGEPPALAPAEADGAGAANAEGWTHQQARTRVSPLEDTRLPPTVERTLVAERDLLLARALQLPGVGNGAGRGVVGVVGAGHVAGIAREWAEARSPAGYARAAEYSLPVPEDALPPGSAVGALPSAMLAAGIALLAVRRPRVLATLAAGAAGTVGLAAAMGAAGVRNAGRAIDRLNKADEQLRANALLGTPS